jgi:hypothetical protein
MNVTLTIKMSFMAINYNSTNRLACKALRERIAG